MTPEQYKEHKRHTFDCYIKKALKREAWSGYSEIKRRLSREISFSDLPTEVMEQLALSDKYSWDHTSFFIEGDVIVIENEALAHALCALPSKDRDIFLMHWFLNMGDKEIAYQMHLSRRTVNDRRRKSYQLLKNMMRGDSYE